MKITFCSGSLYNSIKRINRLCQTALFWASLKVLFLRKSLEKQSEPIKRKPESLYPVVIFLFNNTPFASPDARRTKESLVSHKKILYVYFCQFLKLCFVASTITTSLWLLDMLSEIKIHLCTSYVQRPAKIM